MAHSLSPECTPLKLKYDACFNTWLEGYLESVSPSQTKEQELQRATQKADEYQAKCGSVWESYKQCVQGAVRDKGLTQLLDEAREEHPLAETSHATQQQR